MRPRAHLRWLLALGAFCTSMALNLSDVHADARTDARRYFTRGMKAIAAGQIAEGIGLLERAYAIRPHPNVLYNLARAHERQGDLEATLRLLQSYVDTDPADAAEVEAEIARVETRLRLRRMVDEGLAAIAEGRPLEGVAFLQRAYGVEPHPNLLFNMAKAYEQAGESDKAVESYRRYLEGEPSDADAVRTRIGTLLAARPSPPAIEQRSSASPTADPNAVAERVISLLKEQGLVGATTSPRPPSELIYTETATSVEIAIKDEAGYEEVVVTASRREQSPLDAPNAVTVLTDEDIRLSGARSIPELLRRVPGMDVMAMSYSDWNVSMRGFNRRLANKILVLVDGRSVHQDFLGATVWSTLSIGLPEIERIEVVRGPGSAIYGAYAYTGIINIITKRPERIDGAEMELAAGNANAIEGSLLYGKRHGPVGARVSVGYARGDKFELEFDPTRADLDTRVATDPGLSIERARVDAEAEYALKSGPRFFVGGGVNGGVSEFYGVSALRNQQVDGSVANLRGGFKSELFSVLVFWDRIRAESRPQFFPRGGDDLGSTVRGDLVVVEPVFRPSFSFLGTHDLVLGAEFRHKFIDWTYLDAAHEEDFFALFAQDQWVLDEQWTVLVSGRLDRHPLIGFLGSPRGALIFKPTPTQALRLSVGTAFRQPTQSETYLSLTSSNGGVGVTLAGNRDLDPERILTFDLGYLNQGEIGQFEIVTYLNRVEGLIVRSDLVRTSPEESFDPSFGGFVAARSLYQNESTAYWAVGSEVAARAYPTDGLDLGASYAFQYIFDPETGDRFTDSPLHKINVWGQVRTDLGLDVGLSFSFTSSQEWREEISNPSPRDPVEAIQRVTLPLDAYAVLSGRVGYRLFDDALELSVVGSNLTQFGDARDSQHPLGNRTEARVLGVMKARF